MDQDMIQAVRQKHGDTICWMLGLKGEDKKRVKDFILQKGVRSFLLDFSQLDLPEQEKEKIQVLIRILENKSGDIKTMDFDDMKAED